MLNLLIRPLRQTVAVLVANDSSRQIAAGVAIGVVLGLAPKTTLLAWLVGVMLAALRVNRAAGLGVAGLVSMAAPWIDPFTHKLGLKVLTVPSLQEGFAWLYDAPLGAWLGFHNTVVCGSFLLGIYLTYPVYLGTKTLTDRLRPAAIRFIQRYRLARLLLGADLSSRMGVLS